MLPETEKILTKFRELNRRHFYDNARHFVPAEPFGHGEGSYYGHFDEVGEIYSLMYTLHLQLDEQIFIGYYDNAYSSPIEPITILRELNDYLKGHIGRLQELNDKYKNQLIPVKGTLEFYLKTQTTIEYVLNLSEIKNNIGDTEKDKLITEIIQIKTDKSFRQRQLKIFGQFSFYFFCLFVPTVLIIIFWNDHRNGKWFQLGIVLFPIISFLYDRKGFVDIFKFTLSKKIRSASKEKIKNKISKNYR